MVFRREESGYYWLQNEKKIKFIEQTHTSVVTVREVIGNLPKIGTGEENNKDNLHIASMLSEKNLERIRHSVSGGTWRDWPENLILDCHKKRYRKIVLIRIWKNAMG